MPDHGPARFCALVIDTAPGVSLVQAKSLKLFLGAFHEGCTVSIGRPRIETLRPQGRRMGATGIRAAAPLLMVSGKPLRCPVSSRSRIRVCHPILAEDEAARRQPGPKYGTRTCSKFAYQCRCLDTQCFALAQPIKPVKPKAAVHGSLPRVKMLPAERTANMPLALPSAITRSPSRLSGASEYTQDLAVEIE